MYVNVNERRLRTIFLAGRNDITVFYIALSLFALKERIKAEHIRILYSDFIGRNDNCRAL